MSWLHHDAFLLRAEVIEVNSKPTVQTGTIGRDAFGNIPEFSDIGARRRAIVSMGKQDVNIDGIKPIPGCSQSVIQSMWEKIQRRSQ